MDPDAQKVRLRNCESVSARERQDEEQMPRETGTRQGRTAPTGDPHRGEDPQRTHHRTGGPHRGPTQNTHRHSTQLQEEINDLKVLLRLEDNRPLCQLSSTKHRLSGRRSPDRRRASQTVTDAHGVGAHWRRGHRQ